jgi:hypothetical protein
MLTMFAPVAQTELSSNQRKTLLRPGGFLSTSIDLADEQLLLLDIALTARPPESDDAADAVKAASDDGHVDSAVWDDFLTAVAAIA